MKKKFWVIIGIVIFIIIAGSVALIFGIIKKDNEDAKINTFDACVEAGYPIIETYPRQCKTPDGRTFSEESPDINDLNHNVQLANPASVYCQQQGGTFEIREGEDGQVGYCIFSDKSECEEWAFYRGECKMGDSL